MGIIKRLINAIRANCNAAIDTIERPEIMLDQQIRIMDEELTKVKADTASVIATQKGLERKIAVCQGEVEKYEGYAKAALEAGNEEDAVKFIDEQLLKEDELADLNESLTIVKANAIKMKTMHNDLAGDISHARDRSDLLKSKLKVAKTQETINRVNDNYCEFIKSSNGFNEIDEKITRRLDEALAYEECLQEMPPSGGQIDELKHKYDNQSRSGIVQERLAQLKASMAV